MLLINEKKKKKKEKEQEKEKEEEEEEEEDKNEQVEAYRRAGEIVFVWATRCGSTVWTPRDRSSVSC